MYYCPLSTFFNSLIIIANYPYPKGPLMAITIFDYRFIEDSFIPNLIKLLDYGFKIQFLTVETIAG